MRYDEIKKHLLERLEAELPDGLFYHGVSHTLDVLRAVEEIARREGVTDTEELVLLKAAALFHDAGYIVQYENNEPVGADMAKSVLPEFGCSEEDAEKVAELILATAIPQNPRSHWAEILCDADLDYLGRDDFFPIADALRRELAFHGKSFSDDEWTHFELDFLKGHKYFTASERDLRDSGKKRNLEVLRGRLL